MVSEVSRRKRGAEREREEQKDQTNGHVASVQSQHFIAWSLELPKALHVKH